MLAEVYLKYNHTVGYKGEEEVKEKVFLSQLLCVSVLRGDCAGLDSKYFSRRDDSVPLYGLTSNQLHRGNPMFCYFRFHLPTSAKIEGTFMRTLIHPSVWNQPVGTTQEFLVSFNIFILIKEHKSDEQS